MMSLSIKLTRPIIKKLLKLYMSDDCGSNKAFIKEVTKTFSITEDEAHLIWQIFDLSYEVWFRVKSE